MTPRNLNLAEKKAPIEWSQIKMGLIRLGTNFFPQGTYGSRRTKALHTSRRFFRPFVSLWCNSGKTGFVSDTKKLESVRGKDLVCIGHLLIS